MSEPGKMESGKQAGGKRSFQILHSPKFPQWLNDNRLSLAFSTYQRGKIFFVGLKADGNVSICERTFRRCMGIWSDTQTLWLSTSFQLWRLENSLAKPSKSDVDRLYVPRIGYTTGDIDVHDITVEESGRLLFANTRFSCVSTVSDSLNFKPVWKPPFVSRLTAEDRCHLNGLACVDGRLRYVTACSQTDSNHAWRKQRSRGGCVIDVQSDEIVAANLSMPHSPRWYQSRLWLLESGTGYLGYLDLPRGTFQRVALCSGYPRGLALHQDAAIVGISKPRKKTFAGLQLDTELQNKKFVPKCGIEVFDLTQGKKKEWLYIEGTVEELYDVVVLPNVRRPRALGFKSDEIERHVWFDDQAERKLWTAKRKDD